MTQRQVRLILASGSAIRARILDAAGVPFDIVRPDIDEEEIKRECKETGCPLETIAQILADRKALAVEAPGAYVIGSDQILEFEGEAFDKPRSLAEAKERLCELEGLSHTLMNAISIAKDGSIVFRHFERPTLHMRPMFEFEIDAYLDAAGEEVLSSVGAYQVEALGARLFDRIDGDYFAVLGLSLHPLLGYLRREGLLAF